MHDLISRQSAIDALRYAQHRFTVADEAGGMGTVKWSEDVIYFAAAERVLSELPSAQPEIIRCKDCKHKPSGDATEHDITFPDDKCPCQCEDFWYSWIPSDDWYCGSAERREVTE